MPKSRLGLLIALSLAATMGHGGLKAGAPLAYELMEMPAPHDAPSVVLCRGQLFACSNDGPPHAIFRMDPVRLRILEQRTYRGLGQLHQITTDGRMLYAAYFTREPETFGLIKVDPETLAIRGQLRLENQQLVGFPEGFAWHDGYLYVVAYGNPGYQAARIARIEPQSMTFAGAITLPEREGCHGVTYDGFHLYALGVPGQSPRDHYYKIDPDRLEVVAALAFPAGLHHYGGNVYLARNGFVYTSPDEDSRGALVKIDPRSFSIVSTLPGAGAHWLASEGRYVYLVAGGAVRVVDPDAMAIVGESRPRFRLDESLLHYGYVAGDGNLYLGFEAHTREPGFVGKMSTFLGPDPTPPLPPQKIFVRVLEGVPTLEWPPAADPESSILEYRIYRAVMGEPLEHLATVPGVSQRYSDRSARAGTTYLYAVAPVNGAGVEGGATSSAPLVAKGRELALGRPLELTFASNRLPHEGWLQADFLSPSGRRLVIPGFYEAPGRWTVRFTPDEIGPWTYAVSGTEASAFGAFECLTYRRVRAGSPSR